MEKRTMAAVATRDSRSHGFVKIFMAVALALAAIMTMSCCSDDDDKVISASSLPSAASAFLNTYYPGVEIAVVTKDHDKDGAEYEVVLRNGHEIEFDKAGNWVDVDAPISMSIPDGIAPATIVNYIAEKFNGAGINEISRSKKGYEVELVTGIELTFSPDGAFTGFGD